MPKISLIIPMYEGENRIAHTLGEAIRYLKKENHNYEIIVVDDGSKDNGASVVNQFSKSNVNLIKYNPNKGKGFAIKIGVLHSTGDYIFFMDDDLPYPINNFQGLLEALNEADISIGSRALPDSKVEAHPVWYRRILGRTFNLTTRIFTGLNLKDTQCGFKGFKKDVAINLFKNQKIKRFGFDVEVLYLAKKYGYKIKEVPIHLLKEHSFKRSKLKPIKDSSRMFIDLLRIRINDLTGKYNTKTPTLDLDKT